MKSYEVQIVGVNGLILHNGQLANPMNQFAKEMKRYSGKRKKVDADYEALARLEYEGSLYTDNEGKVVVPSQMMEACVVEGAKVKKEGKVALSNLFVDTHGVLSYDGGPLSVADLIESPAHRLTIGVVVNQSRVMRTRPLFNGWSTSFKLSVADVDRDQLHDWLIGAGNQKGLGDWRPRYGRFTVKSLKPL